MSNFDSGLPWVVSPPQEDQVDVLALPKEEVDSDIAALEQQQSKISAGESDIHENITKTDKELQLENILSQLLKYGVFIACAVVLWGGLLYLNVHGSERANYQFFRGEPDTLRSPVDVMQAASSGSSSAIIQLGLLILIATPILRVIISLVMFFWQRNFIYVILNLLVLSALLYSLIGAYY
ncbi:hypothetical protein CLI64_20095 [Nostoc sp. CENA543]|uniref:DUF1634 domain-containing protein n=1 Tax=Nostoc sp. CENA543 TaxID=1869241 RepID=UPI000CA139A5|nr:DUF1634 domain-containing protein [Nostoc sp. CENA543]AUT04434.1 hypothetical protein CLI64_20095 [Nostoc sp. CENA543]